MKRQLEAMLIWINHSILNGWILNQNLSERYKDTAAHLPPWKKWLENKQNDPAMHLAEALKCPGTSLLGRVRLMAETVKGEKKEE